MDLPSCIKSKAVLISSSGMVWVMKVAEREFAFHVLADVCPAIRCGP
jgi:hypothetical protein